MTRKQKTIKLRERDLTHLIDLKEETIRREYINYINENCSFYPYMDIVKIVKKENGYDIRIGKHLFSLIKILDSKYAITSNNELDLKNLSNFLRIVFKILKTNKKGFYKKYIIETIKRRLNIFNHLSPHHVRDLNDILVNNSTISQLELKLTDFE